MKRSGTAQNKENSRIIREIRSCLTDLEMSNNHDGRILAFGIWKLFNYRYTSYNRLLTQLDRVTYYCLIKYV